MLLLLLRTIAPLPLWRDFRRCRSSLFYHFALSSLSLLSHLILGIPGVLRLLPEPIYTLLLFRHCSLSTIMTFAAISTIPRRCSRCCSSGHRPFTYSAAQERCGFWRNPLWCRLRWSGHRSSSPSAAVASLPASLPFHHLRFLFEEKNLNPDCLDKPAMPLMAMLNAPSAHQPLHIAFISLLVSL